MVMDIQNPPNAPAVQCVDLLLFQELVVDVTVLNLNLNLIVDGPGSSSAFDVNIVPICVQSRLETVH